MLKSEEKDIIKENITNKGHKIKIFSSSYRDNLENNVNEFLLQIYKKKNVEIIDIKLVSEWVCFIHYKFVD